MKRIPTINLICLCLFVFFSPKLLAQDGANSTADKEAAYTKVINGRASKITEKLGITDSAKFKKVTAIIAGQYRALNDIYAYRDTQAKAIKKQNADNKDAAKTQLAALDQEVTGKIDKQHVKYLSDLSAVINPAQVDLVKDWMTYNVRVVTYNGYTQMLPDLTEPQKKQIMDWLIEAREHSMDAESSEKKHAWFGKYKGRINNYLSAAGIDMKKAEADWEKRIKEKNDQKG